MACLNLFGVDAIWISPIFESPQVDPGSDVSNYEAVHKPYRTVTDVQESIEGCHARAMKILLDLVINHTSDQHAWFHAGTLTQNETGASDSLLDMTKLVSASLQTMEGGNFSGIAWQWDEHTQEY